MKHSEALGQYITLATYETHFLFLVQQKKLELG